MVSIAGLIFWVLVAIVVLSYMFMTTGIDMARLKAWETFASRYKLEFERGRSSADPITVSGLLNNRRIVIYTQPEQTEDERTVRLYSHIEVYLNRFPATRFIISKKHLHPDMAADMEMPEVYTSTTANWPQVAVSSTENRAAMESWMTPQRIKALKSFMDIAGPHDEVMFMGDGEICFLLWRSENALPDARELNALVQKIYAVAREMDSDATGTTANPNASSVTVPPEITA
ncbi:MAG: hypothetical protein KGQ41_00565 [Alphaproteobacteria bacterium]|nr:hypothetical protein [Alphaproteobacteria bacterium]